MVCHVFTLVRPSSYHDPHSLLSCSPYLLVESGGAALPHQANVCTRLHPHIPVLISSAYM